MGTVEFRATVWADARWDHLGIITGMISAPKLLAGERVVNRQTPHYYGRLPPGRFDCPGLDKVSGKMHQASDPQSEAW